MEDLPKVTARYDLQLECNCPHCGTYIEVIDLVEKEQLGDSFNAINLEVDVTCPDCGEDFIINETEY